MLKTAVIILVFIEGFLFSDALLRVLKTFLVNAWRSTCNTAENRARSFRARGAGLEETLPEVFDTLSNALRSGSNIVQAMDAVVKSVHPEAAKEFNLVLREIKFGVTLQDALGGLAGRVKIPELDLAVTAVSVSQETGGSLSDSLKKISFVLRERNKITAKTRALTSQGRMQAAILGALPVVLGTLIFFIDPSFIAPLFTCPLGWGMLAAGLCMEITGFLFLKKVISIEV